LHAWLPIYLKGGIGGKHVQNRANQLGFKLTFGGTVTKADMQPWFEESKTALNTCKKPFGVIVDMRGLELLPPTFKPRS
jgi:hypothetical protein